ncbi:MAG: hypothetical protein AMJ53_11880 [Gammaproteobacteria bacterium SG8_11]|nr:MAG: hypothetical protein AMJ53_11880 [Gammaproteobacteria bacterium SG8_11]
MEQFAVYLALHGVLILLVSLISGRWFSRAITTGGNEVAWRVVHSGGSMGGIMLIAFSSLLPIIALPRWATESFVWSTVAGIWFFVLAMIVAAITGERGLKSGGTLVNRSIYCCYFIGAFFSLIGCSLLLTGLIRAL